MRCYLVNYKSRSKFENAITVLIRAIILNLVCVRLNAFLGLSTVYIKMNGLIKSRVERLPPTL